MGETKKELRFFTITQYNQEEEYLSSMHKMGWKFTKVIFPGLYYFEECEPENVTYRLDYNQEGIRNKAEYVQMFSDCGWEYLFDFAGYSYFRKGSDESDTDDEIFCDDESRLDMMKRVYRGRIIPLIVLFCCTIFPQFLINSHNNGSVVQDILSVLLLVMGMLYLCIFLGFSIQFYKFEKKIHTEDEKLKWKYVGIFSALFLCAFVFVSVAYLNMSSKYTINDRDNGFAIEAERLNRKVVKEYELKKGDIVEVKHQADYGSWYVSIGKEDEEPVFYGNTYEDFADFSVEIQEAGIYEIQCKGRSAQGHIEFVIK